MMDAFAAWNLRLLESFFSPASQGEEVWLSVDAEELDIIGHHLGGDAGFLEAVRNGPSWPTVRVGNNYCRRGDSRDLTARSLGLLDQRVRRWSRPAGYIDPGELSEAYSGCAAPSYLPVLAALVRASASLDQNSYYTSLQHDLALDSSWGPQEMARIEELWSDLQRWTAAHDARFGQFTFRQLGGFRRIGVPRSQSIISRQDAKGLTRIFAQAGVRAGQHVSERLLSQVQQLAAETVWLSRPLLQALASREYSDVVRKRLAALLEDWDGSVILPAQHAGTGAVSVVETPELQLALTLSQDGQLPWQVRWRVPSPNDSGEVVIQHAHSQWVAPLSGDAFTLTSDGPMDEARDLLARTAGTTLTFDLLTRDQVEGATNATGRSIQLAQRPLRTLVADQHEAADGTSMVVLVEHGLPAHGHAYLLVAPQNVGNLQTFLGRGFGLEECPCDGLPQGWQLFHIPECELLDDDARDHLPDGQEARTQPRILKLVGGRQIQRGGLRQYLPYDLPGIELDAPPGTEVRAAGLELVPQDVWPLAARGQDASAIAQSSLRRFGIVPLTQARLFQVEAVLNGKTRETLKLRLAPEGGLLAATSSAVSLDSLGNLRLGNLGLRGVTPGSAMGAVAMTDPPLSVSFTRVLQPQEGEALGDCPAAEFLDSLAQMDSMAYGSARDQLRRLLRRRGRAERDALTVLRELQVLGHLEIEADSKGRWVRVHAVPPALYLLPLTGHDGCLIAAMGGTLRQGYWDRLQSAYSFGIRAELDSTVDSPLPAVRLLAHSRDALKAFGSSIELDIIEAAAQAAVTWSAEIAGVREGIEASGVDSLGSASNTASRFMEATGEFVGARNGVALTRGLTHELFQFDDGETGHHKLFSLGFVGEGGRPRYGFVRDSRWGVWIALVCFGLYLSDKLNVREAAPWPLSYSHEDRTLWVPWRLRPPLLLERALVLCSGTPPLRLQACKGVPRGGAQGDEGIILDRLNVSGAVGTVSRVYDRYVPAYPSGALWLGYRWVPPGVAKAVASRLGACVLDMA